jgi:hypothetical protein
MSARPSAWPQVSGELLPNTLFNLASRYPDIVYAEYFSEPKHVANNYRKVTYREFANAVHGTAWWIEECIGKPIVADGRETMVYLGPNDLRYGILVLASILVGYKVCQKRFSPEYYRSVDFMTQDAVPFTSLWCRSHCKVDRPNRW